MGPQFSEKETKTYREGRVCVCSDTANCLKTGQSHHFLFYVAESQLTETKMLSWGLA